MHQIKNKANKINVRQLDELERWQKLNGFKPCPKRAAEKAESMPAIFGRPGPNRRQHPYASA